MAALRKSRRGSRKASRKASRRGRRRQKAGGTVTIYFFMNGAAVTNVFSSNPGFTVEPTSTPGQVKLGGTSTAKITGITVNALGASATAWDLASAAGSMGSMNTAINQSQGFYVAKGASASQFGVMRPARPSVPAAVAITPPGLNLTENIKLFNLHQGNSWKFGTTTGTAPSSTGAIPPGAPADTATANIRVILATNP